MKKIFSLALLFALSISLFSCGKKSTDLSKLNKSLFEPSFTEFTTNVKRGIWSKEYFEAYDFLNSIVASLNLSDVMENFSDSKLDNDTYTYLLQNQSFKATPTKLEITTDGIFLFSYEFNDNFKELRYQFSDVLISYRENYKDQLEIEYYYKPGDPNKVFTFNIISNEEVYIVTAGDYDGSLYYIKNEVYDKEGRFKEIDSYDSNNIKYVGYSLDYYDLRYKDGIIYDLDNNAYKSFVYKVDNILVYDYYVLRNNSPEVEFIMVKDGLELFDVLEII